MGRVFAIVLTIITLLTAAVVIAHVWWLPPPASAHGIEIDHQLNVTFIGVGTGFLVTQLLLAALVWRFRARGKVSRSRRFPGGAKGPILVTLLVVGIELVGLELVGSKTWAQLYYAKAPANAVRVYVLAEQFAYFFRYPGPDAQFGAIHTEKMDDSTGNSFGLDKAQDKSAQDDVVTGALVLPVNRPVQLILHSKDVSHSFYVPELRVQQDFVPGIDIPIQFTPTKVGDYQIVCTQLCGMGHYSMKAPLRIVSEDEFATWLKGEAADQ